VNGQLRRPAPKTAGITLADVRAVLPAWAFTEAEQRAWVSRPGQYAADGPGSLIRSLVVAGDAAAMSDQLRRQEWLEYLRPAKLAVLWDAVTGAVAP